MTVQPWSRSHSRRPPVVLRLLRRPLVRPPRRRTRRQTRSRGRRGRGGTSARRRSRSRTEARAPAARRRGSPEHPRLPRGLGARVDQERELAQLHHPAPPAIARQRCGGSRSAEAVEPGDRIEDGVRLAATQAAPRSRAVRRGVGDSEAVASSITSFGAQVAACGHRRQAGRGSCPRSAQVSIGGTTSCSAKTCVSTPCIQAAVRSVTHVVRRTHLGRDRPGSQARACPCDPGPETRPAPAADHLGLDRSAQIRSRCAESLRSRVNGVAGLDVRHAPNAAPLPSAGARSPYSLWKSPARADRAVDVAGL